MLAKIVPPSVASQERKEMSHLDNHTHKNSSCKVNGTDAWRDHPVNNRIVFDQGVSVQNTPSDIQGIVNHNPTLKSAKIIPHSLEKTNNTH